MHLKIHPSLDRKDTATGELQQGDSDAHVRGMAFVPEEIKWTGSVVCREVT